MSRIDLPDPRRSGAASSGASARIRSRSRRGQCLIIGGVCLLAVLIERWTSFELDWRSWGALSFVVAFIGVLSAFYTRVRRIDDGRLGETLHELAIFLTYGPVAAMISYLMAALALPLQDSLLAQFDRMLGFDWPSWYKAVAERPTVEAVLSMLYRSSLPQLAVLLLVTGLMGRTERTRELNILIMATSLPMVLISGAVPALCAWIYFDLGLEKAYHLEHVTGLRDGSLREIGVGNLLGIVTFPSFHTAMAMMTVWVARGIFWLFWPAALLNVGVLLSLPSEGGHHLVDVLAGALITSLAILMISRRPGMSNGTP